MLSGQAPFRVVLTMSSYYIIEHRLMSDINMLAVTGGKERSAVEWKKLLSSAGFGCQRIIPVPGELVSIIEAARRV